MDEFYVGFEPVIACWATLFKNNPVVLDAGCGEGLLALKIAETFRAKKLILTDRVNIIDVDIPVYAEFHQIDICSAGFLERFRNQMHVVVSTMVFHEFANPLHGLANLFGILPEGGLALLIDHSEAGWRHQEGVAEAEGTIEHYRRDIENVKRIGIDTDAGIKGFWERKIFPMFPGQAHLCFYTGLYAVAYRAWKWGRVKPVPPREARSDCPV